MTSDREDRRVRRGHAWAREAQDFAPRHAQDPLSLLVRVPFLPEPSPAPPPSSLCLSLPPFFFSLCSLPPPPGVRREGLARPSVLLARSRHVILRDWPVSCPRARAALCLCVSAARCTALSGGRWLLCIHVPSLLLLVPVPFSSLSRSSFRNDQDLPMIFNAGSATRPPRLSGRLDARFARDHGRNAYYVRIRLLRSPVPFARSHRGSKVRRYPRRLALRRSLEVRTRLCILSYFSRYSILAHFHIVAREKKERERENRRMREGIWKNSRDAIHGPRRALFYAREFRNFSPT